MQPDERDAAYVWDILDSAQHIQEFMKGVRFEEFLQDRKLQLAIERCVEIMGEASRRISDELKNAHPEIPWSGMIAQRNVLAHEYDDVKQERMWLIATVHTPALIPDLEAILPPPPPTE
ncbi:MAG: DUF86 domain-containing protein [Chloroflexi bacterium]|nr:MAG: DUF86 domain-containing protein [Chloroflexota bacterium]MCQ3937627.1 DUF86 domain-containing protein [Chloroflexota bacterium]MDL1944278.1 DUF86 domain-containing protein [Chloroflexi bacterium CFX2]